MKLRIKSMIWNIRKQKTTNQDKKKKKIPPPNENTVSTLWDNFKHSNIHIVGVAEGEEKDQEIENFFEKIMKETPPNLVKEIDKYRKHRESQTIWTPRGPHQDTS